MRLMWLKTLDLVLGVVLFSVAFGQARPDQQANVSRYYVPIWGRIVGYTGAPIRNQRLVLSGTGREAVTTQTDQDGGFRFESVEGNKPASLQMDVTGFSPAPIDIGMGGGDTGTVVLQPVRPIPLMDRSSSTNGSIQALLSGRITDANGVPMADKGLSFGNRSTGFFLQMDANGAFVAPAASNNEYEIYVTESGILSMLRIPKLKYVGNIVISNGQDVDLGNFVLRQTSSKKGQLGDIAGTVMGDIAGPVKITAFESTSNSKVPSTLGTEASASTAGIFCGADGATVIHEDGNVVRQPKEKEQVGCSSPKISADKKIDGWLVDSDFCCTSYPLQFMLVVYRPGKPLRHFTGDGRAIFGWNFVAGGKQVAFFQSYPHGDLVPHYELRDVPTERLIRKWDGDSPKAPSWTGGLGR
jgi:hypothetical protein